MARRRVTVDEAWGHKAPRFTSMKILRDGRVRFSHDVLHPALEFSPIRYSVVHRAGEEPYGLYDSSNYGVSVMQGSIPVFSFVITRNRIAEGTFAVLPDLRRIRRSVKLMFEAGFGKWLKGGLENTLRSMTRSPHATPYRLRALRQLIDSLESPSSGWMLPPRPGAPWRRVPPRAGQKGRTPQPSSRL